MATRHGVQSANVNRGELKLRSGPTIASVINAATTIVVNSMTAPITYVAGRLIASSALFRVRVSCKDTNTPHRDALSTVTLIARRDCRLIAGEENENSELIVGWTFYCCLS